MADVNETNSRICRFLNEADFAQLYKTFIEAFSDYVFPFALTEQQFRNHINLNGVELDGTIGCFEAGRMVGFSLNGFGDWNGVSTVYDAGTGVIPSARRRGASEAMFDQMLPVFKEAGIGQCLLEVITSNTGAIRLYEKLGFGYSRELALMQCDRQIELTTAPDISIEVRSIEQPDWELMATFWTGYPSWQNSVAAMNRSLNLKTLLGAYVEGSLVGYVAASATFGRIAQIAVSPHHRNKGIGTMLLKGIQNVTAAGYSLQVINIDKALDGTLRFLRNRGFYERIAQHELIAPL